MLIETKVKRYLPNILTGCRIFLSMILLHLTAFSSGFYVCYLIAGITDMIDGTIARKFGVESEFGEKFDTIADTIFVISVFYKLFPVIEISMGIWIWIGVITGIKVINIILGLLVHKKIVAIHSWANKITGLLLFALPFSLNIIDIRYSVIIVCLPATFAAIQEWYCIRT